MKVKIKMNVPKPPTGIAGITFFGACYKWNNVFYRMGEEYTVKKADFNPAIMVDITVNPYLPKAYAKKLEKVAFETEEKEPTEQKVEEKTKAIDEIVTVDTSDYIEKVVPEKTVMFDTSDEVPTETQKERKHRKK